MEVDVSSQYAPLGMKTKEFLKKHNIKSPETRNLVKITDNPPTWIENKKGLKGLELERWKQDYRKHLEDSKPKAIIKIINEKTRIEDEL